ncbi:MAG: type I restriction enzyme HsdR N-terminal domain-containing protein [Candidatus Shikimatogenerans sp. Ttur]|uniref:Type I restriction enzyme HsdR N-terminal domain-containing protein n=1 Tax=Candidatus Shikimatogenerans sp. Ttur TaxID=3158569 RepID=A0AAU7ZYR3_9FLAO
MILLYKNNLKIFNNKYIYCFIRKKKIILTPEEFIRQNILYYIIYKKKFNINNILVEKKFFNFKIDILLKKKKKNFILIECKSFKKNINIKILNKILIYKKYIKPKYTFFYNGKLINIKKNKIKKYNDLFI